MELKDRESFFWRACFSVVGSETGVLSTSGDDKNDYSAWDVAGSVFDDVISNLSGSSEGRKL